MSDRYNSQAFTPEEVEQGLHLELLNYLLGYNVKSDKHFNDIHITSDGYCTIIEWTCVPYSGEFGGKFTFLDEDEEIFIEKRMPDDTYQYFRNEEEYQDVLAAFLKEHPTYKQNAYGIWYDENEQKAWEEEIAKEVTKTKAKKDEK